MPGEVLRPASSARPRESAEAYRAVIDAMPAAASDGGHGEDHAFETRGEMGD
jgi:hypothetical protein